MDCQYVKGIMAAFLSGTLDAAENDHIENHLMHCPVCQKEMDAYKATWEMLGEWPDEEPDRSYLSRFWTRLSVKHPWKERFLKIFQAAYFDKRLISTAVPVSILIVVGFLTLKTSWQINQTELLLTALSAEEIEFLRNWELAENFELLEQMDVLEQLDGLDGSEEKNDLQRGKHVL